MESTKQNGKESTLSIIITIILILLVLIPTIMRNEKINFLYLFLIGLICWSIGKRIKSKKENIKKAKYTNIFLNNFAVSVYILLYLIVSLIVDFDILKVSLVNFYLKMLVGVYVFLYMGLIAIKEKKIIYWNSPIYGKEAIITGLIYIIISLIIIFSRLILQTI